MNTDRIKKIKNFIKERKIEYLIHFTNEENLKNILKYGLLSKELLEQINIKHHYNDEFRVDNRRNRISLSITFPNCRMFYKYRSVKELSLWCVLLLDPSILYEKNCLFCSTNAANKEISNETDENLYDINSLYNMFTDSNLPLKFTRDVQAEVLVQDYIESKYIKYIIFNNIERSNFIKNELINYVFNKNYKFISDQDYYFQRREYVIEKYFSNYTDQNK